MPSTKWPTNSVHVLGRGHGAAVAFVYAAAASMAVLGMAVTARGAEWRVGLIGADFGQAVACGWTHWGLVAHTRHQAAGEDEAEEEEEADESKEDSKSKIRRKSGSGSEDE